MTDDRFQRRDLRSPRSADKLASLRGATSQGNLRPKLEKKSHSPPENRIVSRARIQRPRPGLAGKAICLENAPFRDRTGAIEIP